MPQLTIPATMDDITPEWLTAALRERGHLKSCSVVSIEKITIGQGFGTLGELCRMTPTYSAAEASAPRTLIAKIPTADPGGKGLAQMFGFYDKEAQFYDGLCQRIGIRAPRGYYTAGDPETIRYVILMEDLDGLRFGDQIAGASATECRVLMHEAARLHSRWWNSPDLDALDWIPPANSPVIKLAALAYAQALDPFLQNFGSQLTPRQVEMAQRFGSRMNQIQDAFTQTPLTLCHGDLRLDNVFWGSPDGSSPVTLIDWQIAIKARGPYDAGYFMSQSVDPAVRSANEETLLRDYYRCLAENGVTGYTWDQCWDDYRATVMFCFLYPVLAGGTTIDLADDRELELGRKILGRSLSAIDDLKAYEILDRYEAAPLPAIPG